MNFQHFRISLFSSSVLLLLNAGTVLGAVPTTVVFHKSVLLTLRNPVKRVAIADPSVIAVPDPYERRQLQINGTRIGATSLIIWEAGEEKPTFFDIEVVGDRGAIEEKIREYAPNDAITVQYANDTVILSGTVANEKTKEKAGEIARAYVAAAPNVPDAATNGNPAATATAATSGRVLNYITIGTPLQVLLQVKVAQVDKTSLKQLGISTVVKGNKAEGFSNVVGAPSTATQTTTSGGATTTSTVSGTPGINGSGPGLGSFNPLDAFQLGVSYFPSGIGAVLQALTSKGLAKVLAEPNLLVNSGKEGKFFAGSKIPYSVLVTSAGASNIQIDWEPVGITLNFKPEVRENGLIHLVIDPAEVASISGTLGANGYPIIDTRNVRTDVELKDGESLILAGLLQEEAIKNMSKIPLLGDIPILGALFRSTENDLSEKELIFFITPKIQKPTAPGVTIKLPTDKKLTPRQEKEYDWMPLGN